MVCVQLFTISQITSRLYKVTFLEVVHITLLISFSRDFCVRICPRVPRVLLMPPISILPRVEVHVLMHRLMEGHFPQRVVRLRLPPATLPHSEDASPSDGDQDMSSSESQHGEAPIISPSVGGEPHPLGSGENISLSSKKGSKRTNEEMGKEEESMDSSWRKRPKVKTGRRIRLTTITKTKHLVEPEENMSSENVGKLLENTPVNFISMGKTGKKRGRPKKTVSSLSLEKKEDKRRWGYR